MSINVSGNLLSSTGFTSSGEIANTPNIVTDGLVLWLDAGNLASYNNSATYYDCGYGCQYYGSNPGCTNCNTQVKDMSGYGNDGALALGAAVRYTNYGGGVLFDGSNDTLTVTRNSDIDFSNTTAWSIQMSFRIVSHVNTYPGIFYKGNSGAGGMGVIIFHVADGSTIWKHNNGGGTIGVLTIGSIYNIAITYSGSGNVNGYLNGVSIGTLGTMSGTETSTNLIFGKADEYGNDELFTFMKYSKQLSATEVLQNFNTDRSRFGI
jgi:hypothetical protein